MGAPDPGIDATQPLDLDPDGFRRPGQHTLRSRITRRRLAAALLVLGLGVAVGVRLLGSGQPMRPGGGTMSSSASTSRMPGRGSGAPGGIPGGGTPGGAPSPQSPPPTASLAAPPPAPRPVPFSATYEAEAPENTLAGTAQVMAYPHASGGRIVTNIGNWVEGNYGSLRFNGVRAPKAGTYRLTLFYVFLDNEPERAAVVTVSGSEPVTILVPGDPTCCWTTSLTIRLRSGDNTITVSNPDGAAPSLDKIAITAT